MDGTSLRALVESEGAYPVARKIMGFLEDEDHRLTPEKFSIRELWESFVGPCNQTLAIAQNEVGFGDIHLTEANVDSTAFPTITGLLISKKVIDGYRQPIFIGSQLVTNMPSNRKIERIAGFTAADTIKEVPEGQAYDESDLGEKFVTSQATKKGRIISLTEEAVYFDQTG